MDDVDRNFFKFASCCTFFAGFDELRKQFSMVSAEILPLSFKNEPTDASEKLLLSLDTIPHPRTGKRCAKFGWVTVLGDCL